MSELKVPPIAEEAVSLVYRGFTTRWYKFFEAVARKGNLQDTGWTTATGFSDKGVYAVYAGTAIGNPPTQAQVQAMDAELVKQSKRMVALEEALRAVGAID